jgi:hypothetical protein
LDVGSWLGATGATCKLLDPPPEENRTRTTPKTVGDVDSGRGEHPRKTDEMSC